MRHLLSLGHKHIACNLGETPPAHFSVAIRESTYQQCMREAGLIPEEPFIGPVDQLVGRVIANPNRPTAILDYEHWKPGPPAPGVAGATAFAFRMTSAWLLSTTPTR